ncbi:hypothetical protein HDU97_004714 [Phlyctochytrium planicorne]|nr:hypothetical protein HDU97_004714 [Phlyctochytrium planicorne]
MVVVIISIISVLLSLWLRGSHAQQLQTDRPQDIRSLSVRGGTYYVVDSSILWMTRDLTTWTKIPIPLRGSNDPRQPYVDVKVVSAFGTSKLAIVGSVSNGYFLHIAESTPSSSQEWRKDASSSGVERLAGNAGGRLFSKDNGVVMDAVTKRGLANQVFDFTVNADRVYMIQGVQICSRGFEAQINDLVCVRPSFEPGGVAATREKLFVITASGKLYVTKLPLTTVSAFFDTGFLSPFPRSVNVDLDNDNNLVVLGSDSTITPFVCDISTVKCDPPSASSPLPEPVNPGPSINPTAPGQTQPAPQSPQQTNPSQSPSQVPGSDDAASPSQTVSQNQNQTGTPGSPSTQQTGTPQSKSLGDSSSPSIPLGGVIGGSVGVIVLAVIVSVVAFSKRSRRKDHDDEDDVVVEDDFAVDDNPRPAQDPPTTAAVQRESSPRVDGVSRALQEARRNPVQHSMFFSPVTLHGLLEVEVVADKGVTEDVDPSGAPPSYSEADAEESNKRNSGGKGNEKEEIED